MYVIPGSRLYREARYEKTQNFNDMRRSLMRSEFAWKVGNLCREQSLKRKIANCVKISRFGDFKQVEELLNGMKVGEMEVELLISFLGKYY